MSALPKLRPPTHGLHLTPKQQAWLDESRARIGVVTQRIKDLAAAEAASRTVYYEPEIPPADAEPHWPGREGRHWGERNTCTRCGKNLRRFESLFRPCGRCEEEP